MKRRFLSICLALALCLSLLPATALAAGATVYGTIEVGGVALTNTQDNPVVYATTDATTGTVTTNGATAENYNVMWDGTTLTLRNATIEQAKEYGNSHESMAIYLASGNMNLALVGENTVDALGGGSAASCGINLGSGSLSISGADGASLTVYGGPTERGNSCGIYANGTITINSGTVTATGESASAASYGICARGAVTIEDGTVNATSGEAGGNSVGIHITNSITINGGDVTATAGDAGGNSYGIHTAASSTVITVNGGSVTATSGEAKGDSCGIFVESKELASIYSSAAINGGSVTAYGGDAVGTGWYSCGMKVDGKFTISGGTITAKGGDARGADTRNYSIGLIAYTDLTIKGGTVIATGVGAIGTTTDLQLSFGIFSLGNVNISGGDVTGIGGTGGWSGGIVGNSTLTITGGTVVGEGGPLAGTNIQYSAGINGMDKVEISGGTVTATGGTTEQGNSGGIYSGDTSSAQLVEVSIKNATVTATGGTAKNGDSSGIFASNANDINVQVTIEDATVTATGGTAGTGSSYGILAETTGTDKSADVTINGNSVVRANMTGEEGVDGEPISAKTTTPENSIVFENGVGIVYGEVTLQENLTVDTDESLTIPQYAALTIPNSTTLTNSGTITNEGTLTNNGTLTIGQGGTLTGEVTGNPVVYTVTVLTDGNGTASASEIYAAADDTVTLTATPDSGYHFERWEVVSGGVTVENNAFTMPAQPVTVKAIFDRNSSGSSSYTITTPDAEHGTVAASPSRASSGTTVTITVTPDEGYELGELIVTDANGDEVDLTRESATKYTFEMPRSRVTVAASFVESEPEPLPFDDVDDGDWFADAVRFVYENGMMNGTDETTFSPDATTSRAMIVTILWRLENEPVVNYLMDFTDVDPAAYYAEAVRWAASEGIVTGTSATSFAPGESITREQLATMLYRYAQTMGYDVSIGEETNILSYTDFADMSEYAIPAMQWACGAGIINGTSESTLTPQGSATRAQVAAMIMRFCENAAQ